jgi:putative DNA primase/helicase
MRSADEQEILAHLAQAKPTSVELEFSQSVIKVDQGRAPEATDEAEKVLVEHSRRLGIFQRGGELVAVIRLPEARQRKGLHRPAGTLMLEPLSQARLSEVLDCLITFQKFNLTQAKYVTTDCPAKIVTTYLSRKGHWKLPSLLGTIAAPLMRENGTILSASGYDDETGLFLNSECEWLPLAEYPAREDAQEALQILKEPFAEFPFVSDEDLAVALVAILTALQRRLLPACPLIGYSAPAPRSGKSLLAEAPAIIAMGKPAPASACSSDREEFRKSLTAVLREGQLITNLDNIELPLKSSELCMIITQEEFSDRLLGESTTLHLPTNVFWTATGNNLTFRGDLANRALLCRIDAEKENPEERTFAIKDLKAHLVENRARLVRAALTILRAFHLAGKPEPEEPLKAWGGFEEWSATIREPLVWAGASDPCKTRERILSEDPEKEAAGVALQQLAESFGDEDFVAGEAASRASEKLKNQHLEPALYEALKTITGGKAEIDAGRLGHWLRSWRGRFVNGYTLQRMNRENINPAKWRILKKP